MTYWTQPYPQSIEDAQRIRRILRGEQLAPAGKVIDCAGMSFAEVQRAADELRRRLNPFAGIDAVNATPWAAAP